jgi:short subunit dehydrogenase-like uncharacterized protein
MTGRILIYGSYGYTGDLAARFAQENGVEVVLSARNSERPRLRASRTDAAGR